MKHGSNRRHFKAGLCRLYSAETYAKFSTGCLTIFIQRRTVADSCPTISAGDEVSFRSVNLEGAQSEVIRAI